MVWFLNHGDRRRYQVEFSSPTPTLSSCSSLRSDLVNKSSIVFMLKDDGDVGPRPSQGDAIHFPQPQHPILPKPLPPWPGSPTTLDADSKSFILDIKPSMKANLNLLWSGNHGGRGQKAAKHGCEMEGYLLMSEITVPTEEIWQPPDMAASKDQNLPIWFWVWTLVSETKSELESKRAALLQLEDLMMMSAGAGTLVTKLFWSSSVRSEIVSKRRCKFARVWDWTRVFGPRYNLKPIKS